MASYVDGFLIPVPKKNLAEYRRISSKAGRIWMEFGALQYIESVGDDLKVKGMRSFQEAADARAGEVVLFSWAMFRSKAQRDAANKKIMADPRMAVMMTGAVPFDVKRMAFGGFRVIVEGKPAKPKK